MSSYNFSTDGATVLKLSSTQYVLVTDLDSVHGRNATFDDAGVSLRHSVGAHSQDRRCKGCSAHFDGPHWPAAQLANRVLHVDIQTSLQHRRE